MAPWMNGLIRMENSRGGGGRGMGAQLPPPYMGVINIFSFEKTIKGKEDYLGEGPKQHPPPGRIHNAAGGGDKWYYLHAALVCIMRRPHNFVQRPQISRVAHFLRQDAHWGDAVRKRHETGLKSEIETL